jgi:hypothetical protein
MPMPKFSNVFIILLQLYFLLMNWTVERYYCMGDLTEDDDRFLMKETYAFCKENNPYFLARPEWLRVATCVSAFVLCIGYSFIIFCAYFDAWDSPMVVVPCLLFVGLKTYAIYFYHLMEFTSSIPPQNLVPYFAAEGPYVVSLVMVLYKCMEALTRAMDVDNIVAKAVKEALRDNKDAMKQKARNALEQAQQEEKLVRQAQIEAASRRKGDKAN